MKELRFTVNGQELNPEEQYTGIMRGSSNYLNCMFSFGKEWQDYRKVVQIRDVEGNEHNAVITNKGVLIPGEVTQTSRLYITVYGRKGETTVKTNTVAIEQL